MKPNTSTALQRIVSNLVTNQEERTAAKQRLCELEKERVQLVRSAAHAARSEGRAARVPIGYDLDQLYDRLFPALTPLAPAVAWNATLNCAVRRDSSSAMMAIIREYLMNFDAIRKPPQRSSTTDSGRHRKSG